MIAAPQLTACRASIMVADGDHKPQLGTRRAPASEGTDVMCGRIGRCVYEITEHGDTPLALLTLACGGAQQTT